jgi:hypothetical protein
LKPVSSYSSFGASTLISSFGSSLISVIIGSSTITFSKLGIAISSSI